MGTRLCCQLDTLFLLLAGGNSGALAASANGVWSGQLESFSEVETLSGQFVASPIHWAGEEIEEEKIWSHDVLNAHRCERCHLLAKKELSQALLEKIRATVEQFQMATLTEADIAGLLEELIA